MFSFLQLGFLYLYFPEDKTEYIPVVLEFLILLLICILVFRWLIKKSRRDALKAKEIEDRVLKERREQQNKEQLPPQ